MILIWLQTVWHADSVPGFFFEKVNFEKNQQMTTKHEKFFYIIHNTYAPPKFEVASSNSFGGDTFSRQYIIWPYTLTLGLRSHKTLPVPSTSCDRCTSKVKSCYIYRCYNSSREDTITRIDVHGQTDGRPLKLGTKLICPFCLKKKKWV